MTRKEFQEMVTFHGKDKRSFTPPAQVLCRALATLAKETEEGWSQEARYWGSVDADWDINMCRPVECVNEGWYVGLSPVVDNSTCTEWDCTILDYPIDDPEDLGWAPSWCLHAYLFTDEDVDRYVPERLTPIVSTDLNIQTVDGDGQVIHNHSRMLKGGLPRPLDAREAMRRE